MVLSVSLFKLIGKKQDQSALSDFCLSYATLLKASQLGNVYGNDHRFENFLHSYRSSSTMSKYLSVLWDLSWFLGQASKAGSAMRQIRSMQSDVESPHSLSGKITSLVDCFPYHEKAFFFFFSFFPEISSFLGLACAHCISHCSYKMYWCVYLPNCFLLSNFTHFSQSIVKQTTELAVLKGSTSFLIRSQSTKEFLHRLCQKQIDSLLINAGAHRQLRVSLHWSFLMAAFRYQSNFFIPPPFFTKMLETPHFLFYFYF